MNDPDPDWTQRHIAAFRNHRGHQACLVKGCIGSQPLMWVPTEADDQELAQLEEQVAALSEQAQAALDRLMVPPPPAYPVRGHIHWAW